MTISSLAVVVAVCGFVGLVSVDPFAGSPTAPPTENMSTLAADTSKAPMIAFTARIGSDAPQTYVVHSDGTGLHAVTQMTLPYDPNGRFWGNPVWSPNGRQFAFVASPKPGISRVYVYSIGRDQAAAIYSLPGDVESSLDFDLAWSADGKWIVLDDGRHIYRVHPDGSGFAEIPLGPASGSKVAGAGMSTFVVSPQGTIALRLTSPAGGGTVAIISSDLASVSVSAPQDVDVTYPWGWYWSPDGGSLAVGGRGGHDMGQSQVWIYNVAGQTWRQVTSFECSFQTGVECIGVDDPVGWSRDGRSVLFFAGYFPGNSSTATTNRLYAADMSTGSTYSADIGGTEAGLSDLGDIALSGSICSGGRLSYQIACPGTDDHLHVVDTDTNTMSASSLPPSWGSWSYDGSKLAYFDRQSSQNPGSVMVVPVAGGQPTVIVPDAMPGQFIYNYVFPVWQPSN